MKPLQRVTQISLNPKPTLYRLKTYLIPIVSRTVHGPVIAEPVLYRTQQGPRITRTSPINSGTYNKPYIHTCMHTSMYIYMYIYIDVYMYISTYVDVHIHIYMYTCMTNPIWSSTEPHSRARRLRTASKASLSRLALDLRGLGAKQMLGQAFAGTPNFTCIPVYLHMYI